MQVVLVQPDVVWENRAANFERVRALLASRPPRPGALVVLPEMFAVGFSMNVAAIHEGRSRPTERFLAETAREYGVYLIGGLVTRGRDRRGRNEALVVTPEGEPLARYAKLHPFRYAGETRHYAPGEDVVTFSWAGFVVAPFICYDLRFPEVYRLATARGAQVLVTIANFPAARVHHWTSLLVARAIENQAYAVGVNRCGADPNVAYPGHSLVVSPQGRVIADAGGREGLVSAELDLDDVTRYRATFPALQDMRPDFVPR
jgi:predicted amidohydrolase